MHYTIFNIRVLYEKQRGFKKKELIQEIGEIQKPTIVLVAEYFLQQVLASHYLDNLERNDIPLYSKNDFERNFKLLYLNNILDISMVIYDPVIFNFQVLVNEIKIF